MWLEIGNVSCRVVRSTPEEKAWLTQFLCFEDDTSRYRKRSGYSGQTRLYSDLSDAFPTGLLPMVRRVGQAAGITVETADKRARPVQEDKAADLAWLRDYQLEAVRACAEYGRGVVWLTTGAGKTEIAVALTRLLPCRWLFLVRDRTLLHQAADRYEQRTDMKAGRVGDDTWLEVPGSSGFTCATYQTLAARIASGDPRAKALLDSTQGVIADECHGVPGSQSYWTLARMPNAYFRIGLSGTPLARGDQKSLYTIAALGPVIYKLRAEELIEAGVLARPVVTLKTCEQETDAATWTGVYHDLVTGSARRNRLLVDLAKRAAKPCLVFAREIDHGRELERRLIKAGLSVEFVWGESSVPVRQAAITRLVRGDIEVIVSSTVFQVGVDIPSLASIVVGTGGKSVIETLQRVGRGMRTDGGRKMEFQVWDVMDRGNKMLEKHARRRAAAYSAEGYQTTVED